MQQLDDEWMVIDGFVLNGAYEFAAKRVVAQNSNGQRGGFTRKSFGRPFDEFCEIEEEGRLDLIFRWLGLLRYRLW